jgi:hypothetical protein
MKRALIWFCWGERYVAEAVASARTAAALQLDRFLITDAAGKAQAQDCAEFTLLIETKLVHANNLEKSRLVDLLPEGYDTFLFLDCDVCILGDVRLGFEKAERHGIAMAPAPNYNLGEFFGFWALMTKAGVSPADQMIYNSGVVFFHLTAAVRAILERWRDLCVTIGAPSGFHHDQPFLTLAFEQIGFIPYALSPLYNYRAMGEYAVGRIRIWHSHHPPPADANVFEHAWPPRRFTNSDRTADSSHAPVEPRRMPQSMLRLKLAGPLGFSKWATLKAIPLMAALRRGRAKRETNERLVNRLGLAASADLNEQYYAEALNYHLGLVHAYLLKPQRMAEHIRLSQTMPSAESDQIFSDHVNLSHAVRAHQIKGVRRRLPAILISCMPRSASATITHTLAQFLDIPVFKLSIGQFPDYFLAPSWLDMFLEGGGVTQDHFGPSRFNLGVLAARERRDLFVIIRDPRAAARSQVRFLEGQRRKTARRLQFRIEETCVSQFIPWLQGWIDVSKRPDAPVRIHWLTYDDARRDPAAMLRKISRVLRADLDAMSAYVDCEHVPEVRIHYGAGDDDAWRGEVSDRVRERLWRACTPDIISLLDLRP